jgi:hypothetical protein
MMAIKKKSVELIDQKISYTINPISYKVVRFYPEHMTVDVMVEEDGVKKGMQKLPFAHLPKEIKKLIKPN